jgi:hypothetical protein
MLDSLAASFSTPSSSSSSSSGSASTIAALTALIAAGQAELGPHVPFDWFAQYRDRNGTDFLRYYWGRHLGDAFALLGQSALACNRLGEQSKQEDQFIDISGRMALLQPEWLERFAVEFSSSTDSLNLQYLLSRAIDDSNNTR